MSAPERLTENADGTIIVTLERPTKIDTEPCERVTVRPMRGREMRLYADEGALKRVTGLMDLADALSTPTGAVDACLCEADVNALVTAAVRQLGKFHGTDKRGGASSGSSAPGTDSPPPSSSI